MASVHELTLRHVVGSVQGHLRSCAESIASVQGEHLRTCSLVEHCQQRGQALGAMRVWCSAYDALQDDMEAIMAALASSLASSSSPLGNVDDGSLGAASQEALDSWVGLGAVKLVFTAVCR